MGSQQQLLIILSIIIVGAAIVIGMDMFTASYDERVTEMVIIEVHNIGIKANVYKKTPSEWGGGGGSYAGFESNINKYLEEEKIVKELLVEPASDWIDITMTINDSNAEEIQLKSRYMADGLDQLQIFDPVSAEWKWYFKRD